MRASSAASASARHRLTGIPTRPLTISCTMAKQAALSFDVTGHAAQVSSILVRAKGCALSSDATKLLQGSAAEGGGAGIRILGFTADSIVREWRGARCHRYVPPPIMAFTV